MSSVTKAEIFIDELTRLRDIHRAGQVAQAHVEAKVRAKRVIWAIPHDHDEALSPSDWSAGLKFNWQDALMADRND